MSVVSRKLLLNSRLELVNIFYTTFLKTPDCKCKTKESGQKMGSQFTIST